MGGFSTFSVLRHAQSGDAAAARSRGTRLGSLSQHNPARPDFAPTQVSPDAAAEWGRHLLERSPGGSATDGSENRFRRHARVRPHNMSVVVLTEGGFKVTARILDISQSGVALEGTMPGVWVGCMVTVGSRRAKAVRMLPNGMALEFSVPLAPSELDAYVVL